MFYNCLPLPFFQHSDPRLQLWWFLILVGLSIFVLIPLPGGMLIVLGVLGTWKEYHRQIIRRPLIWGLGIFSLWLLLISAFAPYPGDALLGTFNFLPYFIVFAGLSTLIQIPSQLRLLSWIIVITSIPVVILGLGQLWFSWSSPLLLQGIVGWVLESGGNPPGRIASVFMYANTLASYLIITLILSLGLWVETAQKLKRIQQIQKITRFKSKIWWCWLILSLVVVGNAIALILTDSRNAWAIAFLGSLAFAIYYGWRWLITGITAIATVILWSAFGPDPIRQWLRQIVPAYFWARLTDQLNPNRPIADLRTTQWKFAWELTQQRPFTGWGLRNFTPLYQAKMQFWLGHPHNLLLMLTSETGIPATMLFFGLIGWVFAQGVWLCQNWSGRKQDQLILFSYLVAFAGCTLFNTVDVSLFDFRVNTLGWFLLSGICGITDHDRAIAFSAPD